MLTVVAGSLTLLLAACSGGSSPSASAAKSSHSPTPTATTPAATTPSPHQAAAAGTAEPIGSQPGSGANAIASVKADWTQFFDPTTPVAKRVALLQNGARFRHYLQVQAGNNVDHLTTEQVTAVQLFGTGADVTYNILIGGHSASALENQSGQAMFAGGTWKITASAFCSLLTLENKGKTLPGC